jgi:hypothetical protein
LLTGTTLREIPRRGHYFDLDTIVQTFRSRSLLRRGEALFWLFLPAIPLLRRGWAPVIVFPSLGLLILLLSPEPRIQILNVHYPAAAFTGLVLGMLEALRRHAVPGSPRRQDTHLRLAAFLILVSLAAYGGMAKRLPFGPSTNPVKVRLATRDFGRHALRVARNEIPRRGLLLTETQLVGLCANRADVLVRSRYDGDWNRADILFMTIDGFKSGGANARELIASGQYGITYWDGALLVLQRGADTARNREISL